MLHRPAYVYRALVLVVAVATMVTLAVGTRARYFSPAGPVGGPPGVRVSLSQATKQNIASAPPGTYVASLRLTCFRSTQ